MVDLTLLADEQQKLAKHVKRYDDPTPMGSIVTGVDVAYSENVAAGYAVVMDNMTKEIMNSVTALGEIASEYIPGFFQLREGPILIELIRNLERTGPILVDGNGILHPRRFGLASYLGLKMNVQTIGVAKKLMLGTIGERIENSAVIMHESEVVGQALWLNEKRPVYVSVGHRISLDTAVNVVVDSSVAGYPDVLRRAHVMSRKLLSEGEN